MIVIHTDVPSGGYKQSLKPFIFRARTFMRGFENGPELFSACLDRNNFSCGWNTEMEKPNAK